MRMLRKIKGVTVKDKMKSEDIRKELEGGGGGGREYKKQDKVEQAQMVWAWAP